MLKSIGDTYNQSTEVREQEIDKVFLYLILMAADPDILTAAIVTALQSIPTLTASPLLADGANSILAYFPDVPEGDVNIEQTIIEQPAGSILVHWIGTRTGNFAKNDAVKHDFALSLKPKGRVAALFMLIREGVCTTSGLKFKHTQVTIDVRLPEELQIINSTKFMTERYGLRDFSDITFTLTERGVDV